MNCNQFKDRFKEVLGEDSSYFFAKKSGISESLLRKYLSGESLPGLDKLNAIADIGNVNIEWLATGRGPKDKEAPGKGIKEGRAPYEVEKPQNKNLDLVGKTIRILESDTIFRQALAANITAFHRAILLEKENEDTRQRMSQLEENNKELWLRLSALEEKLSRGDQGGGHQEDQASTSPLKNGTTGT
jgi:transcriptional regulator with XRE-family HTH domain